MYDVEPNVIFAGDSVSWRKSFANYQPAAGWKLRYSLRGLEDINIDAATDGDGFLVTLTSAVTAGFTAGEYSFGLYAYKEAGDPLVITERVTLLTGHITIKPDPTAAGTGEEALTHNAKMLKALREAYAGSVSATLASYQINGTSIVRMSKKELEASIARYEYLVRQEKQARRALRGGRTSRLIKTVF